jgi:hypothetical protein
MLLTVVAMVVAMMVVMAGTASAQARFISPPLACFTQAFPAEGRDEPGSVLLVPGEAPNGNGAVCTGRPIPGYGEPTS